MRIRLHWPDRLERKLAAYHDRLPHLSLGVRVWMTNYIWTLVLLVAILVGVGAINLLLHVVNVALVGSLMLILSSLFGFVIVGWLFALIFLNVFILFLMSWLLFKAIGPLRARRRLGWQYLVCIVGIGALWSVNFSWGSILSALIVAGGLLYVLFEVRYNFIYR